METNNTFTVAIIGGGPAGLTAALYLGRAQINTLVIDADMCGGQIISSPLLENVPGFYGPGADLAMNMLEEVSKYPSVQFANFTRVSEVHPSYSYNKLDGYILILDDGTKVTSDYVICATGSQPIHLPNTDQPNTHYCVTCDGPLYENKTVAVVGGGNSALQYALELTKYARQIYIVTNEDYLRGEEAVRERVFDNDRIEVITRFPVSYFNGSSLESQWGDILEVDGIFVAVGYRTNTDYISGPSKVQGRLITDEYFRLYTMNNVFAVGDCRYKKFNQVVIAMSEGCQVALQIISDLEK